LRVFFLLPLLFLSRFFFSSSCSSVSFFVASIFSILRYYETIFAVNCPWEV